MGILLNGLHVLDIYKWGVFLFFATAIGLGWWGLLWLRINDFQDLALQLISALGLGCLILAGLSFATVLLRNYWEPALNYGSVLVLLAGMAGSLDWIRRSKPQGWQAGFLLVSLFFILNLLIRLAFLKGIILPPYDDSPEHYLIIQGFLSPVDSGMEFYSPSSLASGFYHYGFHCLVAWFSSVTNLDLANAIPLLGQLLLVIWPCSIYALVYSATQNKIAGIAGLSLSVFAWRMPAFAVNWGKYPAIAGLALFPAVLAIWILYRRASGKRSRGIWILSLVSIGLIFVHSRLAICLVLALLSLLTVRQIKWIREMDWRKVGLLSIISIVAFVPFWNTLSIYYDNGYFLSLILVAVLLPFGYYFHPHLSLGVMFFTVGAWAATGLSVVIGGLGVPLLDQPFVETLLSIPLSIFGGVGFVGLLEKLSHISVKWIATIVMFVVVVYSFTSADVVYPDMCCNYVSSSDMQAIQWLKANTSHDATVWIAAYNNRNYMIATDAGAWVHALTSRNANRLDFGYEWDSPKAFAQICRPEYEDVYVYKGGTMVGFEDDRLIESSWLMPVYTSGQTKIYKVTKPCVR